MVTASQIWTNITTYFSVVKHGIFTTQTFPFIQNTMLKLNISILLSVKSYMGSLLFNTMVFDTLELNFNTHYQICYIFGFILLYIWTQYISKLSS